MKWFVHTEVAAHKKKNNEIMCRHPFHVIKLHNLITKPFRNILFEYFSRFFVFFFSWDDVKMAKSHIVEKKKNFANYHIKFVQWNIYQERVECARLPFFRNFSAFELVRWQQCALRCMHWTLRIIGLILKSQTRRTPPRQPKNYYVWKCNE